MIPYFALLIIPFLFCFVAKSKEKHKLVVGTGDWISRNNFAIPVFFFLLWLMLTCRSTSVGNDTYNYWSYFDRMDNYSLQKILTYTTETAYWVFNWFIGQITDNFQVFLGIASFIMIFPIARLYARDRRHSCLKIVIFINMSVFIMLLSGIRQAIAMAIGLIAYEFVKNKKLIPFIITAFIAWGFHESAFMIFAMYPLYFIKLKKKHLFFIIPMIAFVYIFNQPIFGALMRFLFLFTTRYENIEYSYTGAITTFVLFLMFTLFAYIIPDDKKVDAEFNGLRNFLVLATMIQCFAPLHETAMRMNYYYILFIPMVVPMVLDRAGERWKQVAKVAEIVMCVFFTGYFIMNVISYAETGEGLHTVPYIPFWAE